MIHPRAVVALARRGSSPALASLVAAAIITAASAVWLEPRDAAATPTRYWTLRTPADYAQAELDGVSLDPDGALVPGPALAPTPLGDDAMVWALLADGDRVLAGTGADGKLLTIKGSSVESDTTGDGQVLSLARGPDGAVYAGTGPSGRIVRITGGRATTWFETKEKYVWGLAFAGKTLYAATGPTGKLFAIDTGSAKGRVVLDAKAAHLSSVVSDGKDGVFVGAAGRGIVYHVKNDVARALFEAPEKEIKALAFDGRSLFVAALSSPPLSFSAAEAPEPSTGEGQRAVVYRIVPDSVVATHWVAPQGLIYGLAVQGGDLWVATGSRAGLYRVDARGRGSAVWSGTEGQATAIVSTGKGELALATSNPGRLYRVRTGASGGSATSPVLDAKRLARWGRLWIEGDGSSPSFQTRSGNTAEPDSTWSAWEGLGGEGRVGSPAGRYLQWRARVGSDAARVRAVTVAWGEVNLAPKIDEFTVYPTPGKAYEGELNVRRDPITQELPDGKKVQYNVDVPRRGSADALPEWAKGMRPMSWKAQDPNGDDLTYRIDVRRDDAQAWTPVAVGLSNSLYTWDTSGWPDGRYQVRLRASDEDENAPGTGLVDEAVTRPVDVHREAPRLADLTLNVSGDVVRIRGRAVGAHVYASRVDVALDDGDWFPAAADDGLWDEPDEAFTLTFEGVPPGEHSVRIRAVDSLGNAATELRPVSIGR
jgi:hypothetical protein